MAVPLSQEVPPAGTATLEDIDHKLRWIHRAHGDYYDSDQDPHQITRIECNRFNSIFIQLYHILDRVARMDNMDLDALIRQLVEIIKLKSVIYKFILHNLDLRYPAPSNPPDTVEEIPPGGMNVQTQGSVEAFGGRPDLNPPPDADARWYRGSELRWHMGAIARELALCMYTRKMAFNNEVGPAMCELVLQIWLEMNDLVQSAVPSK